MAYRSRKCSMVLEGNKFKLNRKNQTWEIEEAPMTYIVSGKIEIYQRNNLHIRELRTPDPVEKMLQLECWCPTAIRGGHSV